MSEVRGWEKLPNASGRTCLTRKFELKNFKEAMFFVNALSLLAERRNHHPDIHIQYNQVTLELITHDENAITDKDIQLALQINSLLENGGE